MGYLDNEKNKLDNEDTLGVFICKLKGNAARCLFEEQINYHKKTGNYLTKSRATNKLLSELYELRKKNKKL
jgi:hypothetical protein